MGSIDRLRTGLAAALAGLAIHIGAAASASAQAGPDDNPGGVQAEGQGRDAPAWLQQVEGWIKGGGAQRPAPLARPKEPASTGQPAAEPSGEALLAKLEQVLRAGPKPSGQDYVYVDEQGRRVQVAALSQVPEQFRAYAVPAARAAQGDAPQRADHVFRYRNPQGRVVFTNVSEAVPLDQRSQAELDLSRVPLNSQLGGQIEARLSVEHEKLSQSEYCKQAREQADEHRLEALWDEYGPLFVVGAAILVFFLISPMMMRRVAIPDWVRTLRFVVPALAVSGGLAYSMMKTNRAISAFRRKAEPCMDSTWSALGDDKGGLASKLALIQQLRSQIDLADRVEDPTRGADQGL